MEKGLFKKYFFIFICLISISALIFSGVFLHLSSKYFKEDKYNLLYNNAIKIKNVIVNNYNSNMKMYIDKRYITVICNAISGAIDADIFLTDVYGNLQIYDYIDEYNNGLLIPKDVIKKAIDNGVCKLCGNLKGFYKYSHYVVAIPLRLNKNNVDGVIFVSASARNIEKLLLDMVKIFIISFIVVIIISTGIIWVITDKMIHPLKEMAKITKVFAKGDFRKKITINQNNEIGELSASLNEMADELQKIEDRRRYFIASVSHELKTPITTILGFIEGIMDGVIPQEKHKEYLTIISNEVKRLSNVITSMTNLTKIDSEQVKLFKQQFSISEIINKVIFNFEEKILKKQIKIYGLDQDDIFVFADKDLIYQVVYNLIENAVKFTNIGGYIKIRYKITSELVYVGIKNSGNGINEEDLKYIFDKFYKVDKSRNLNKGSIGLGLYIVKQILMLHGSDIEVETKDGEYTEFFFWLAK